MVTRQTRRRLTKAREERFVKSLEEARDTLDSVISQAEQGDARTFDALEDFSEEMARIYEQAERMEGD